MPNRIRSGIPAALAVLAIAAPAAVAAPVTVNVRVEAGASTLFDAPLTTDGHDVTTQAGGTHKCDSTNGNPPANPTPGPSATAALDDAARLAGFTFDGSYNDGFDDFFIERVGPDSANPQKFWGVFVNAVSSNVGGCQQRVAHGDEVLWAYAAFGAPPLRLAGPASATTGAPVPVSVVDGADGSPEPGASVGGATTGADGNATLSFADAGIYRLKADRADAIRSNTLVLCVDPPGADPCTSTDKSAPSVAASLPGKELASERGRSRTMLISWQADDGNGAGVSYYSLEVREVASGARAAKIVPGDWKALRPRTTVPSAHFRGESGTAYQFRITAVDRAANSTAVVTDPVLLPVDDRDRGLWRLRGWERVRSASAWGRTVVRADAAGATGTLRFSGRSVALIGRKLARGGRVRVSVGGRSKVVSLRGRGRARSVVWQSRRLTDGRHVLRIRTLGGGPVELDAVAPQP